MIGAELSLHARIDLGGLAPSDVVVQAVLGRVSPTDDLSDTTTIEMGHTGADEGSELYSIQAPVPLSGAVGYTVRVLPHNALLASDSELGLVAVAGA